MLFDKNNPCYRTILFSHRIILFFRRSQCSLTKTTLLQNHSSLANRTILFFRRSRCFLTKTTPAAEPFYPRAKHNRILSQITMLFDKNNPCCRTMLFSRRTILFFRRLRCYSLWQKQPCCRTILFLRTEQSYSFADHDALWQKQSLLQNHPYSRAQNNPILSQITTLSPLAQTTLLPFLAHRIILFFRRSRCSLTKTTLRQNHSILAHRIILFFRRSRCSLTKTTLLQNHSSLANRTILFFRRSRYSLTKTTPATEPFYSRTALSYSFADHNALWQKQPCCKTILVSQTE